jgi:gliding motility-associated protein GldC
MESHPDGKKQLICGFRTDGTNTQTPPAASINQIYMAKSSINIDVILDNDRVPEEIQWNATDTSAESARKAKAMMLAFWDGAEKTAMRIDLWTKDMMVDEMADFFYQTFMTMAETYQRATQDQTLVGDMKQFAKDFYNKFREQQLKANKL